MEKLEFLLKSSPEAKVELVAKEFDEAVLKLLARYKIRSVKKPFDPSDVEGRNLVIGATNDQLVNQRIYSVARNQGVLVNIADAPDLCDFYMGSIVTKGSLKLAISTNGKSPTMAKRLRQHFEEILPDEIDLLLEQLNLYRSRLSGDFQFKVNRLNALTKDFLNPN